MEQMIYECGLHDFIKVANKRRQSWQHWKRQQPILLKLGIIEAASTPSRRKNFNLLLFKGAWENAVLSSLFRRGGRVSKATSFSFILLTPFISLQITESHSWIWFEWRRGYRRAQKDDQWKCIIPAARQRPPTTSEVQIISNSIIIITTRVAVREEPRPHQSVSNFWHLEKVLILRLLLLLRPQQTAKKVAAASEF